MATEPDFLSQGSVTPGSRAEIDWMTERANAAKAKGARWHRWSRHPDFPDLILHEAWHVKPVNADGDLDEGEPHWQMSAEPQTATLTD